MIEDGVEQSGRPGRASAARRLLEEILERQGLDKPNGQPIYTYRISQEEFQRGRQLLERSAAFLDSRNAPLCAVFALVTSEWYRREATSLWRVWSHIGVVPNALTVSERNAVANVGLAWWGQSPKISRFSNRRRREFLLTLALNGGLPSALIVGETGNRVRRFFEGVMEDALSSGAVPTYDELMDFAESRAGVLPDSYRDETIYELTAELIGHLHACRAKLPRGETQANPAGWLDVHDAGWRERLPIHLPEDVAACNRLFNNLLTVEPRARGGGIGLKRYLYRMSSGDWKQGFVALADGQLAFDALASFSEGRFRAYFSGSAGRLMSREFAQLYRSETEKNGSFTVTSQSIGRVGLVGPVPFSEAIAVSLLRDGTPIPAVCWPGGSPRVSKCVVLRPTEREDRLELLATGSVRSTLQFLFVLTSKDSTVSGHEGGGVSRIWNDDASALWQIEGMALVETKAGERYRVQSAADISDDRRLEFEQLFLPDLIFEDTSLVAVEAPLKFRKFDRHGGTGANGSTRILKSGRATDGRDEVSGVVTVQWQDDEGFIIDRARLLVLPRNFGLRGQIDNRGAQVEWHDLPGWRVDALDVDGAVTAMTERSTHGWLCPWAGTRNGYQRIQLTDPDGLSVKARLHLTAKQTVLLDATGKIRSDQPEMSLSELRGSLLLTNRAVLVDLDLRRAGANRALISRKIEGETPMVRFVDLAQSLLGLSSERGPSVFLLDDSQRTICSIRRPQEQPTIINDRVNFANAPTDGEITVVRSLRRPDEEHVLGEDHQLSLRLPVGIPGPLLVYRRKGDAVTTRPVVTNGAQDAVSEEPADAIAHAALIEDEATRRHAYHALLKEAACDAAAGSTISRIVRTIHSLRGLSPRAMDLTRELPQFPSLLCRLLLAANGERVDSIIALERDLPFLWMAQPVSAWQDAALAEWERAKGDLAQFYDAPEAQTQATTVMMERISFLVERTQWFAGIRAVLGFDGALSGGLRQLAQDHVRLHMDQSDPIATTLIKQAEHAGLPEDIAGLNYGHYATLVAPVVLAALAVGRIEWSPSLAAGLRNAIDIDQNYVTSAFPHCLKHIRS
ncbi:STY4851/ECs_5259 family protein [Rhizobium sp. RU36D]|uniref:STY4851/ECs_5259 family protein n=1 Tax=Rhizobium sp. RU36D TaxID=1907415 RepID=UPI000A0024FF|nr:STY4851/ECs_5259 family protein [Rhizobium sp. RU36D]